MHIRSDSTSACRRLVGLIVLCGLAATAPAATVTIDPSTQHQTIRGWGASSWNPEWVRPPALDEVIREAVDEFGLTRLRLEPPGGNRPDIRRWEWLNDNDDPESIDWSQRLRLRGPWVSSVPGRKETRRSPVAGGS